MNRDGRSNSTGQMKGATGDEDNKRKRKRQNRQLHYRSDRRESLFHDPQLTRPRMPSPGEEDPSTGRDNDDETAAVETEDRQRQSHRRRRFALAGSGGPCS